MTATAYGARQVAAPSASCRVAVLLIRLPCVRRLAVSSAPHDTPRMPKSPLVSSRTRPRRVGTAVRDLLFRLRRRNRPRESESSTRVVPSRPMRLGPYRPLKNYFLSSRAKRGICFSPRLPRISRFLGQAPPFGMTWCASFSAGCKAKTTGKAQLGCKTSRGRILDTSAVGNFSRPVLQMFRTLP